jgi:holo-[acyl-carrier protein] synthase
MTIFGTMTGKMTGKILGVGNDLCNVERMADAIRRYGSRFLDRTFTQDEQALAARQPNASLFYAGRFAAKEAFVKALGSGVDENIEWTDIAFLASREDRPVAKMSDEVFARMQRLAELDGGTATVHVSIAQQAQFASAFVILEARRAKIVKPS